MEGGWRGGGARLGNGGGEAGRVFVFPGPTRKDGREVEVVGFQLVRVHCSCVK